MQNVQDLLARSRLRNTVNEVSEPRSQPREGNSSHGRSWRSGLQGIWERTTRNGQLYRDFYLAQTNNTRETGDGGQGAHQYDDLHLLAPTATLNLHTAGDFNIHEHITLDRQHPDSRGVVELTVAGTDHIERIRLAEPVTPHDIGITFSHQEPELGLDARAVQKLKSRTFAYFRKWRGGHEVPLRRPTISEAAVSWVGAFLGIFAVAALNQWLSPQIDLPLIIPPFGASAVLLYGAPDSKLAQPRNVIGGHLIASLLGCSARLLLAEYRWLGAASSVSLALLAMQITQTTHPPAGASAVVGATAVELASFHGFSLVLTCVLGSVVMMLVAMAVNNLHPARIYPTFWY